MSDNYAANPHDNFFTIEQLRQHAREYETKAREYLHLLSDLNLPAESDKFMKLYPQWRSFRTAADATYSELVRRQGL